MKEESLGVDLGNVIIDHLGFGTTQAFFQSGDYNIIPPVQDAFEALRRLKQERFGENVFVIYNASDVADQKITAWLHFHRFSARTEIPPDRVVRTENGRNKLSVCQRYAATHFIDDRLEVLSHLVGEVKNLYLLRPQQKEVEQYQAFLAHVKQMNTWLEVVKTLVP